MQSSHEWPKLPSIQSMLDGVSLNEGEWLNGKKMMKINKGIAVNRSKGHRRHVSELSAFRPFVDRKNAIETSMSGQLEKLSIQPIPIEPKIMDEQSLLYLGPHLSSYRRNLHSRSYSDYTHPYPTSTTPSVKNTVNQHRRAISTNSLDLLLQHHPTPPLLCGTPSSSSSTATTSSPLSPHTSEDDHEEEEEDDTHSEGSTYSEIMRSTTKKEPTHKKPSSDKKRRTPPSKKYHCTFCSKGFSRPSSLRIHTYSHTGERPFECPEKGCHRKFSVQSNMRRHLRVHRTGRPTRRNGSSLTPAEKAQLINKPLAAKPTYHSS